MFCCHCRQRNFFEHLLEFTMHFVILFPTDSWGSSTPVQQCSFGCTCWTQKWGDIIVINISHRLIKHLASNSTVDPYSSVNFKAIAAFHTLIDPSILGTRRFVSQPDCYPTQLEVLQTIYRPNYRSNYRPLCQPISRPNYWLQTNLATDSTTDQLLTQLPTELLTKALTEQPT